MAETHLILSGDIGGTNTRLCLFSVDQQEATFGDDHDTINHKIVFYKEYKNGQFGFFKDALYTFFSDAEKALKTSDVVPKTACIAVAGPVSQDHVMMTNIGWVIDAREIERLFSIPVARLINDFLANGYGLLTLDDAQTITLQDGEADPTAPIACLGAGTGLGVVFLTPNPVDGQYEAFASEGGHCEYAPRNALERDLLKFLQEKFKGRISVERVVSGKGLVNVYEFLRSKFPEQVYVNIDKQIMNAPSEGAKYIGAHLHDNTLCKQTFEIMFRAYGATAGNLGLTYLPYGGIYIAGGIILKTMELVTGPDTEFMEAFHDKGRVKGVLKNVPLKVVTAEDLGMRGAHVVASRELQKLLGSTSSENKWDAVQKIGINADRSDSGVMFAVGAATLAIAAAMYFRQHMWGRT